MTQEVLKLALEALENGDVPTPENAGKNLDAITAIKEALAKEKALQALHDENERLGLYKDAYAQPEQEPVAWTLLLTGEHNGLIGKAGEKFIGAPDYYQRVNVYTALPQRTEQEPVAVVDVHEFYDNCANFSLLQKLPKGKHTLYTTSPQRTWVGIPEQDLKQGDESFFVAWREGARWAEAKLKEKNCAG